MKSTLSSEVFLDCATRIGTWAQTQPNQQLEQRSTALIGYLKINLARLIAGEFLTKLSTISFVPAISFINKSLVFTSYSAVLLEKDTSLAWTVLPVLNRYSFKYSSLNLYKQLYASYA
jgi:hypothetical protein